MTYETQQMIRQEIIELIELYDKLIINDENFCKLSDKISEDDIQEFSDKLDELGISKLKLVKYSEKNAIKASAKMDEFSDNHYGDSLDEIMEFLGFKNINSLFSGEEYIYI